MGTGQMDYLSRITKRDNTHYYPIQRKDKKERKKTNILRFYLIFFRIFVNYVWLDYAGYYD